MRVLHLLTALGHGGAEIWLLNMLRSIDRSVCAMDFCLKLPQAGTLESVAIAQGARTFHVPLRPSHVGYLTGVRNLLSEGKYDILHSHEFVYSGLGVAVARSLKVPVICTFHHWQSPPETELTRMPVLRTIRDAYGKVSMRYSLTHANYISALSNKVMEHHVPDWRSSHNCRMLRLSTDIPELARSDDRRDFRTENRIGEEDPVILHVGRFIEQKNHAGVLGVFRRVLDRIPSAKLVLLGHGPLKDSVMKQIATMGIETSVRYLGLRNDVPRIMTMSDVFLFPSLDEGFGLAALEANAAGLPVVGSLIDGLREAVVNEETAMLFPVRDVPAMADAVVTLLLDSSKRYAMGQAGRLRARTTYSHEASASRLLELYNEVLTR